MKVRNNELFINFGLLYLKELCTFKIYTVF